MTQPAKRIPQWLRTDLLLIVGSDYLDLGMDWSLATEPEPAGSAALRSAHGRISHAWRSELCSRRHRFSDLAAIENALKQWVVLKLKG